MKTSARARALMVVAACLLATLLPLQANAGPGTHSISGASLLAPSGDFLSINAMEPGSGSAVYIPFAGVPDTIFFTCVRVAFYQPPGSNGHLMGASGKAVSGVSYFISIYVLGSAPPTVEISTTANAAGLCGAPTTLSQTGVPNTYSITP